jgi:hypothetical protein
MVASVTAVLKRFKTDWATQLQPDAIIGACEEAGYTSWRDRGLCRRFSSIGFLQYDLLLELEAGKEREIMVNFKGAHFVQDIILTCARWYVAYPLSYRQVEELMQERGVSGDHATINRWVVKYSPQLEQAFHRRRRPVWRSWRLDET